MIHSTAVIGDNARIFHQVTIGIKDKGTAARIGDNVLIGAGAKVIGDVSIGNDVAIGANSVVTKSFENDKVIAGIPAKIIN